MVVCKCRKATKLYCFVHKVPVCGECICFQEHKICVERTNWDSHYGECDKQFGTGVRTYSEWVIDGEYDWPPKCCECRIVLEETSDSETTRLGCLHVIHTNCFTSYVNKFPPHTAPAGYVCPACSVPIWPPVSIKDSGSRLHSHIKEAIMQTGLEKNLFGNHPVSLPTTESRGPPPAFASDPLVHISGNGDRDYNTTSSLVAARDGSIRTDGYPTSEIVEIEGPSSAGDFMKSSSPVGPGATTRKNAFQVERQNSEISYYADDEDGKQKKYTRRGPFRHKFLRALLPFWSSALPVLPVTAPPRRDSLNADVDIQEVRTRHPKPSRMDPRKILLVMAILACLATMGILYYRLAQRGLGEDVPDDEQQQ